MTDPKLGNKKSIQMTGKMEDMREYPDALESIEDKKMQCKKVTTKI